VIFYGGWAGSFLGRSNGAEAICLRRDGRSLLAIFRGAAGSRRGLLWIIVISFSLLLASLTSFQPVCVCPLGLSSIVLQAGLESCWHSLRLCLICATVLRCAFFLVRF
jgi:hypothetical protein